MTKVYPCLCQAIAEVLRCGRWIGIFPIVPNTRKPDHLTSGCSFDISKFWLTISIIIQVTLGTYIVTTTCLRLFYDPDEDSDLGFDWYVMTLGYMTMETDSLVSLFGGTFYSRRIANTLARLSRLDGKISEMRELAGQLRKMLIFLLVIFCIKLSSFLGVAWVRMGKYSIVSGRNILDSSLGVLIRGINGIFPHIQCALIIMMCLVISSKFKHQAETIKLTLDHVAFGAPEEQTRSVKVRTATVKWMGEDTDNTNTLHLERISSQYKETQLCMEEMNHCVGIQLLVALAANLFVTVYYLYRFLSSQNNYNVIINIQQRIHCMVSLASHVLKLILYLCIGQKLKSESRKPIKALQQGKLLRLPTFFREQIQCLILQWLSSEPSGLSAFNVILVGPWLLAPIVGNVITYLLVAIQFQMNTGFSSMPANLTAILESVF